MAFLVQLIQIPNNTKQRSEFTNMNKTILITGASGTVGTAAGDYLCSQGHNVIGVSRSIKQSAKSYTETAQIDLLEEDDLEKLEDLMIEKEVDAVFHLAWNIPVENFDTHKAWKGNMDMYLNILEVSKNAKVPIFINGSSIHAGTGDIDAYTVNPDFEATPEPYKSSIDPESDFDLRKEQPEKLLDPREENPDSPYGWHKIMTERILKEETQKGSFEIGISIRIGGVNKEDKPEMENEPYFYSLYWSHKDLGRTMEHIVTSDVKQKRGYHQFYGVSDNEGRVFDIGNSFITK